MADPEKTKSLLPALYTSAGQELAQRIQAREFVLVSYMALSISLLGVAIANPTYALIALAVPFLAVTCSLLSAHHDLIIGILSKYMRRLSADIDVEQWHDKEKSLGHALAARTIRDVASFTYLEFTVIAALAVTRDAVLKYLPSSLEVGAWWIGFGCTFLIPAVYVTLWRYRNEKWPFV